MWPNVAPDGSKVHFSTDRGGCVCVLDPSTLEVVNTIKAGQRPWRIAFSADAKYLYSANGPSDAISVVDLGTLRAVSRIKAGQSPRGLVVVRNRVRLGRSINHTGGARLQ